MSKIWKQYKNIQGKDFANWWEDLEDDSKHKWKQEKEKRNVAQKKRNKKRDETSGFKNK